jgi:hypothetical protein
VVSKTVSVNQGAYAITSTTVSCTTGNPVATGGGVSIDPQNGATDVVVTEPFTAAVGGPSTGWTATVRNEGLLTAPAAYATSMTVFAVCAT